MDPFSNNIDVTMHPASWKSIQIWQFKSAEKSMNCNIFRAGGVTVHGFPVPSSPCLVCVRVRMCEQVSVGVCDWGWFAPAESHHRWAISVPVTLSPLQWWSVTKYNYFVTVLKYIFQVSVLYWSSFILSNFYFYFTTFQSIRSYFLLHYIS